MWYVVQVRAGNEENIKLQCLKNVPENILERCFIPYYEEKKKTKGRWGIEKKILFPGYVFVITEKLEELFFQFKNVSGLTKLVGVGNDVVPLSEKEIAFLKKFGGETQVVEMSEGIIENDVVMITSGPLEGMEGYIKKIDRHKRKAWLELPMFGRMQSIQVGLEIVSKTVSDSAN